MAAYPVVAIRKDGSIQLPEVILRKNGWTGEQWFEVEQTPEGARLKPIDPPTVTGGLASALAEQLTPLGAERGEAHTQYVSRWRHESGAVLVSENAQPNIWLSREVFESLALPVLPAEIEMFSPGPKDVGFHSNVASTPGLKGRDVVKLRVGNLDDAFATVRAIVNGLEKLS